MDVDRKSPRLDFQEMFDLSMATTPDPVNISDTFSQREFTASLRHLKPGKALGLDSICPEIIIYAGAALKSWLRDFLSSWLIQNLQNLKKSACSHDPKANKARGKPKELLTNISSLCPLQQWFLTFLSLRTGNISKKFGGQIFLMSEKIVIISIN